MRRRYVLYRRTAATDVIAAATAGSTLRGSVNVVRQSADCNGSIRSSETRFFLSSSVPDPGHRIVRCARVSGWWMRGRSEQVSAVTRNFRASPGHVMIISLRTLKYESLYGLRIWIEVSIDVTVHVAITKTNCLIMVDYLVLRA
jgi:hypothetical protein